MPESPPIELFKQEGSQVEQRTIRVRIGVFFDGTGNNRDNSELKQVSPDAVPTGLAGASYANALTNVALLHGLYPEHSLDGEGRLCLKQYVAGVGTSGAGRDSWLAQATGRWETGVRARVGEAARAIAEQVRALLAQASGADLLSLEFDLFGFSRGAASARHFANDLRSGADSLLALALKDCPELAGGRFSWRDRVVIRFIGLFDTVAAIFTPLSDEQGMGGLRFGLDADTARRVVQLVAADEHRHHFPLVASNRDIVLPGAHADLGGGYPEQMQERVLLCKPRSNRVASHTPAQQTAAYAEVAALAASHVDSPTPRPRVLVWEVPLEHHRARRDDPQKHVYAALYREREVHGHLSRVYLRIMHGLALANGVPLLAFDEQAQPYCLPQELQAISQRLQGQVLGRQPDSGLTAEQQRVLQARYIHTSAHWNPLKGLRDSALDLLYINRPATGGRRVHEVDER
jgi:hypothetical protein